MLGKLGQIFFSQAMQSTGISMRTSLCESLIGGGSFFGLCEVHEVWEMGQQTAHEFIPLT